jgi:hypothetical protein
MGSIGGLLGTSGGASGTGYNKPQQANIQAGTNTGQIGQAYNANQNSLASQAALLAALQSQNGLGAQNNALGQTQNLSNALTSQGSFAAANQQGAVTQQQGLNAQLAGANAVGNQTSALQAQQALAAQQANTAAQYQNIANGTGPNPAQAALNQSTGQNVANQAALMAGQRGAGANVGLLARQAAQQGAATQQQAVGQAATLQAQQQLAGLSGLAAQQQAIGQTQQNVAGIAGQQLGAQQTGIGAQANLSAQQIAQQQAQNAALAGQANTLAGQQIGATTTQTQAQQAEQAQLLSALGAQNTANVASTGNVNAGNVGLAQSTMQGQQSLIGGLGNVAGAGISALAARGGRVKKMADGGDPTPTTQAAPTAGTAPTSGPQSSFGKFLSGWGEGMAGPNGSEMDTTPQTTAAGTLQQGIGNLGKGIVNAVSSGSSAPSGENIAGPDTSEMPTDTMLSARGGRAHDLRDGGKVKAKDPKEKAVKPGNSYDNDKIDAKLSEGEIVLPRTVTMSADPVRSAADFVAKVMAKRNKRAS